MRLAKGTDAVTDDMPASYLAVCWVSAGVGVRGRHPASDNWPYKRVDLPRETRGTRPNLNQA